MLSLVLSILSGFLKPLFSWLGAKIFEKKLKEMQEKSEFEKALKLHQALSGQASKEISEALRGNEEHIQSQEKSDEALLKVLQKENEK